MNANDLEAQMPTDVEKLEILQKEYDRIQSNILTYSLSSFDDFKLIGASLGLVFLWEPVLSMVERNTQEIPSEILLGGFIVILVISAIIGVRDFLKQSLIFFHHRQLEVYETQIKKLLDSEGLGLFSQSENWKTWFELRHQGIAQSFYGLYTLVLILFPTAVLFWRNSWRDALIYILAVFIVSLFTATASYKLYKKD